VNRVFVVRKENRVILGRQV